MNGNAPEFLEAIRLVRKFFPESKKFVSHQTGLDWCEFCHALTEGVDYGEDWSCDVFGVPGLEVSNPNPSFSDRGGIEGSEGEIYERILDHISFKPEGRAIIIPDTLPLNGASMEERLPFVCSVKRVAERLDEMWHIDPVNQFKRPFVFDGGSDSIFVFESGEAFVLQHDIRLFWARSHKV